ITGAHIGSCPIFPPDNIWNRNIAPLPVDPRSDTYIRTIGADAPLHTAFGSGEYNGEPLGIPFITVPGSQPRLGVRFDYDTESDPADLNLPRMGLRVRLKSSVDIGGYPTEVRVILQALKDYGMFLEDNGDPPWNIGGTPDSRWNDQTLRALANVHGSDLEVVD